MTVIETPRLLLRRWEPRDLAPFAAINADPAVMELFPSTLSRAESDLLVERIEGGFDADGFGLWAVEPRDEGVCVGFAGICRVPEEMPFSPSVEIGWRLGRSHWGRGFATEAAHAAIACGFEEANLDEIVSFTSVSNTRSRAVMERLGMTRDPAGDFEHPLIAPGSPIRPHVLYRLRDGESSSRC